MRFITRQGRMPMLLALLSAGSVFVGGAFGQGDTARVPFVVNVAATITAVPSSGTTAVVSQVQMPVSANTQTTMRIPLPKSTGVINYAQKQISAPAIVNNGGGKVTLNLPAQSYKNAEIALYSVNGKQILRQKVSASSVANGVLRPNAAPGAYLLSVTGTDDGKFTSRLTHNGGSLTLNVAFGGENITPARQLAKEAAAGEWTVTVSAAGRVDSVFAFTPAAGTNPLKTITLRPVASGATYTVTVSGGGNGWSGGGSYAVGETVTINAGTPPIGHQFTRWTTSSDGVTFDSARGATTTFAMPANAVTVTANFEVLAGYYTFTVNVAPSNKGTVTRVPDQAAYASGASVKVTANAADGYEFKNWTGASTGSTNPITIIMDGNKTLTANFAASGTDDNGTFTDNRGGKNTTYKTVTMPDGNVWMAENLNYQTASGSWCYENDGANCSIYGRLYDWNTAMTACPSGWHLPSRQEWGELTKAAEGTGDYGAGGTAGKVLKSTIGWGYNGNGTDAYGFSALPGGNRYHSGSSFGNAGNYGYWWAATESAAGYAYGRDMCHNYDYVNDNHYFKEFGMSVRCVRDN